MTILSFIPDKWLAIAPTTDPYRVYTDSYFSNYQSPSYQNLTLLGNRRDFVNQFCDIHKAFDYGCGAIPLSESDCFGCYDKYCAKFNQLNLDTFSKSETLMLFDCLEHMLDCATFLQHLPQKQLILTIPVFPKHLHNASSIKPWKHYKPQEHLIYFTKSGIEQMLNMTGWKITFYSDKIECPPRQDIASIVAERK